MTAFYNEIDPFAAAWLRELIKAGHIAPGVVDERSIEDIQPAELVGFTQCHFFAGIGGWSHALRLAGWPDDRPVWTGSCPCQPFSTAGKGAGFADERHLWPAWFHLISQCQPGTVFGEQVASNDGLGWLDLVQADLEAAGYAVAPVDYCAAGVGAPHIRQRLWFVAHADQFAGGQGRALDRGRNTGGATGPRAGSGGGGVPSVMANPDSQRFAPAPEPRDTDAQRDAEPRGRLGDTVPPGLPLREPAAVEGTRGGHEGGAVEQSGRASDPWAGCDWLWCRDEKWRPVEPGSFPLADGVPARVGRLRGYGNAIVPEVAARIIKAYDATVMTGNLR